MRNWVLLSMFYKKKLIQKVHDSYDTKLDILLGAVLSDGGQHQMWHLLHWFKNYTFLKRDRPY